MPSASDRSSSSTDLQKERKLRFSQTTTIKVPEGDHDDGHLRDGDNQGDEEEQHHEGHHGVALVLTGPGHDQGHHGHLAGTSSSSGGQTGAVAVVLHPLTVAVDAGAAGKAGRVVADLVANVAHRLQVVGGAATAEVAVARQVRPEEGVVLTGASATATTFKVTAGKRKEENEKNTLNHTLRTSTHELA